ncbi:MAG: signal recognition particle receptor subunit alpha, partial [Actinomycetota bacterium]|nr:signal recognition particle receptor subunit alpha [Actinomycetota bacterium]
MEWIYLVLIGLVVLFGIGVLIVSRRRAQRSIEAPSRPAPTPPTRPPRGTPSRGTLVAERPPDVVEAPPEPASLRQRLSKARSAFTGAFAGIRGRRAIDDETWDDLEEALLRADVGVTVSDELLGGLRARVKA